MAISTKALVIGLIIGLVIGGATSLFVKPKEIERVTETVLGPTETVTKTVSGPTVTVTKTVTPTPTPTLTPTPSPSPSPSPTPSPTPVGGIIWENTTWTLENSPYIITETVQIPENVTLTIEPGVTVTSSPNFGYGKDMFYFYGTIYAHGTIYNKIIFEGGNEVAFFDMDSVGDNFSAVLDLEYCIIKNGYSFLWHGRGSLSLKHSELINISSTYPIGAWARNIYIEKNIFLNTGGFRVAMAPNNIYLRYNLFVNTNTEVIQGISYRQEGETIVKYNSFIDIDSEIVLRYFSNLDATENYWGTQDTDVIDSMIYDRKDDISCPGFIEYLPILIDSHPDTPKLSSTV